MANPSITENDNTPLFIGNQIFEDQTILAGENPLKGQVLGAITLGDLLPVVSDPGNTGDGTVTLAALAAGGPALIGDYILTCIDDKVNDTIAVAAAVADGGNTGNGTVTEQAASSTGAPAKQGTWTIECVEAIADSGRFKVVDPEGVEVASNLLIPAGAGNNVVFTGAGITFKVTDGGTDFAVADKFTMAVTGVDGGQWNLKDPSGNVLLSDIKLPGTALGTIVVTAGGIVFTLTDGATDFDTDDFFTITVAVGSGKLKKTVSTSFDGSEIPKFVITQDITNVADVVKSVGKTGIVDENKLVFEGAETLATLVHDKTYKDWLHDRGIFGKDSQHLDFPDNS